MTLYSAYDTPDFLQRKLHIFRQWGGKRELLTAGGLLKGEGFGVQRLARQQFQQVADEALAFAEGECAQGGASVGFVAENLVAKVLEVRPDLVGAPGMQSEREQGKPVEVFGDAVVGDGGFPVFSFKREVGHHLPVSFRSSDIGCYGA